MIARAVILATNALPDCLLLFPFDRQIAFIQQSGIVTAMVGLLAPQQELGLLGIPLPYL